MLKLSNRNHLSNKLEDVGIATMKYWVTTKIFLYEDRSYMNFSPVTESGWTCIVTSKIISNAKYPDNQILKPSVYCN